MLTTLSSLATEQAKSAITMLHKMKPFLNYVASNSEATLTYKASNTVLAIYNNALHLIEPKHAAGQGGHFFLSANATFPPNNGVVQNEAQVMKAIMSLVAEAELDALFISAKQVAPMCQMLIKLGQPQQPTPIQTDNWTAYDVVTNNIIPKVMKAMDM